MKSKEEILDEVCREEGWIDATAAICIDGSITVALLAMDAYADQETAELRRQIDELKAIKSDFEIQKALKDHYVELVIKYAEALQSKIDEVAELKAAKPDIIVPGEEEIEEYIDSGFYAHDPIVNRATRHHVRKTANWAVNRIKELNTPHSS